MPWFIDPVPPVKVGVNVDEAPEAMLAGLATSEAVNPTGGTYGLTVMVSSLVTVVLFPVTERI